MPEIELHTGEITQLYRSHFAQCCAHAEALDMIADHILDERLGFNAYLDEFDRYLEQITGYTSEITKRISAATKGRRAMSPSAMRIDITRYSVRAAQIANAFAGADDAIRQASYLLLKEQIEPVSYDRIVLRVVKEMRRTIRGLERVHREAVSRAEVVMDTRESEVRLDPALLRRAEKKRRLRKRINPALAAFGPS